MLIQLLSDIFPTATITNYVDIDEDDDDRHSIYSKYSDCLIVDPLGRSHNPKLGSVKLLLLPCYHVNFIHYGYHRLRRETLEDW